MNHFEEEYKKRFTDAHSTKGIDSDDIWDNISGALDSDLAKNQEVAKNKKENKRYLFLLFLMGGLMVAFQLFQNEDSENNAHQVDNHLSLNSVGENSQPVGNQVLVEIKSIKKQDNNLSFLPTEKQKTISKPIHNSDKKTQITEKIITPIVQSQSQKVDFKVKKTTPNFSKKQSNYIFQKTNQEDKKILNSSLNEDFSDKTIPAKVENLQTFNKKILDVFELKEREVSFLEIGERSLELELPTATRSPKNMSIGLFGGGNTLLSFFQKDKEKSNFDKTLANAHDGKVGYTVAVELEWKTSRNINFITGIEFMDARTEFNYIQTWDTTMLRNNNPMDIINAKATRTVKHHNRKQYICIPLMVGKSMGFGKFNVGINVGVGANFLISQKGKSLNSESEILEYKPSTNILPAKKRFISYQVIPYLNYQSSDNFAFQIRPSFRFQNNGNDKFYGVKHSSILSGVRLGIVYTPNR